MNILLVTDAYPPEIRSASHLMQELAEGLRDRGHKITVVTSYPQYNLTGELKNKRHEEFSVENEINIIRIKTLPHHKVNFIIRGISQLTMPYLFLSKITKYLKDKIDIVVVYSPPLTLSEVGSVIKKKHGARFILNVQDIFPQNAIDLGALHNTLLIKFFERMETIAYANADIIAVHSEGNREFLLKMKNVPQEKTVILHNWIDLSAYQGERTGIFRKQFGLEDKFIFLFAGVIGPSQGLDLIIKVAERIKNIKDICFLIVGDGVEKGRLEKMVKDLKLKNVIFKPFVSKDEYPLLVKDADVGVACLTSMNTTPVVPSKILGYMAASVPVVAFLNKESDGHKIVKESRCGYSEISDDPLKAAQLIIKVYNEKDRLKQYGENGYKYVTNYFSREIFLDNLEKLF